MDIQLSYTDIGSGEPLILLHGNGEDRTIFNAQIAAFSAWRRVIAVDTRGHGQSPRGSAPFALSQFARDLAALMDQLNIRQADILGFSDGGNIALLFALTHLQRVHRLILSGANLYPAGMKCSAWLNVVMNYIRWGVASSFSKSALRKRELFGLMATQPHIRPKSLQALSMPVLVIAGTRDIVRERHTKRIANALPGGRLTILEGGHAVLLEAPEAFNRAVTAFFADTDSPIE